MGTSGGQWLLSEKSSRLFLVSSIVVLTAYTLLVLLGALSGPLGLAALKDSSIALVAGVAVPAIAVPASFIILIGMPWYWMRFDDSRRFVKLLWLASFLALGWYSMSVYYFVVYRRQRRLAVSGNQ
jgi:hypothetical protein